ncbi:MAG: sugar transferase [Eggerthellaceae bacterium]|nr:sugar transferase [Eggerthellaceae bacterium]
MYRRYVKRFFDLLVGIVALPFIGILLLVLAPIIKAEDGGPVFYNAERRGLHGKPFVMYKFRTMKVNSPVLKGSDGATLSSDSDPRLTKFGRVLRKTSLDEVPQFLNVLLGDMSLVGPRPNLAIAPYDSLTEVEKRRLEVRPGITGYSQAYFRNSIPVDEKYSYDSFYVDNVSFFLDLRILVQTVRSVVARENINAE